jgi:hypothetical protein
LRRDQGKAEIRENARKLNWRRAAKIEYRIIRCLNRALLATGKRAARRIKPPRNQSMTTRMHFVAALLALALAAPAAPALAEEHHDRDHREEHHAYHDFHGHDFRVFTPFELDLWRRGGWVHDWYGGRYGWWWVADGYWYWYPAPVYPYPSYVPPAPPPVVVMAPGAPPPPAAPVVAPPPPPPTPTGQPPAEFWYYCDESKAYYPYVNTCNSPWRQVPATR